MLTPWGTITRIGRRKRRGPPERDSTIDLAWASPGLGAFYEGLTEHGGSDHLAQVVWIPTCQGEKGKEPGKSGRSWALLDKGLAAAEGQHIPVLQQTPGTKEELDNAVEELVKRLQEIAERATPARKPTKGKSAPWWNAGTKKAVKATRRALREHRKKRTEQTEKDLQRATQRQRKVIREAQRAS